MNILIKTIPHEMQRYETVGDWVFDGEGNITIFVSDMGDWKKEMLVAFHELAEVLLCKKRGITQELVDDFDMKFEQNRKFGDLSEPGDSQEAPYRREHFFATNVERLLAAELGVNWSLYDQTINEL